MAESDTEVANLAISHLGIGKEIGNLDSENSSEARAARRFWDAARRATLRDGRWPIATKIDDLALIESNPNTEWGYSYQYPSDCVGFRRILSGTRNDARQTRVAFRIAQDSLNRKLIFTDQQLAQGEWTIDQTTIILWPDDLVIAVSLRWAALMAPRLTKGDPFKLQKSCMDAYLFEISKARANAANEEQPDQPRAGEFMDARY